MKQEKKRIDKGTIAIIVIIGLLITTLVYVSTSRKKTLNSNFVIIKSTITEVLMNTSKGTTGNKNVAKYSYIYKNKEYLKTVEIYNKDVKAGTCYEVKVSNKNPEINEIDLEKQIQCND